MRTLVLEDLDLLTCTGDGVGSFWAWKFIAVGQNWKCTNAILQTRFFSGHVIYVAWNITFRS